MPRVFPTESSDGGWKGSSPRSADLLCKLKSATGGVAIEPCSKNLFFPPLVDGSNATLKKISGGEAADRKQLLAAVVGLLVILRRRPVGLFRCCRRVISSRICPETAPVSRDLRVCTQGEKKMRER